MHLEPVQEKVTIRILPDGRISRADAARLFDVTEQTLDNWRRTGKGPRTFSVGGQYFYKYSECLEYANGGEAPDEPKGIAHA